MPEKKVNKKNDFLMYKNKPLVRCGDIIYYGNMSDKYIIMLQVLSTRTIGDMLVSNKISVSLQYTDNDLRTKDKTLKKIEKEGLYNALDIGAIWLERAME